jgi:glucosamine--fructose-6-phosphate aminotransferase (isomerizing)
MCGIVGAIGQRNMVPLLLEGLRRLEYRGYDSAGVAVINGSLQRLRSAGRVAALAALATERNLTGPVGIAHTRWATHGVPSERNAHPHVSGSVSVVHNGIIENHEELRRRLLAKGYRFDSDTDTEVIAHLVHSHLSRPEGLLEAVRCSVAELTGAYAIAVISSGDPLRLVAARSGAPLLLGLGDDENFVASDVSALLQVTRRMVHLEEGDCAEVTPGRVLIVDRQGKAAERPTRISEIASEAIDIGRFRHYMEKEILEQPAASATLLQPVIGRRAVAPEIFGEAAPAVFAGVDQALILACGTSYHAGLVARHWLEDIAGLPCSVEFASEYRYRNSVPNPRTLVVAVSQSGETADTLAALRHAQSLGQERSLAICNVPESALVRTARLSFLTRAGIEIGVASTKSFTAQLLSFLLLSMTLAKLRGRLPRHRELEMLHALEQLPTALMSVLSLESAVQRWAEQLVSAEHALFLGRGLHHAVALEGALKLKEISYIHAEAYAAGELKHGPLALVDAAKPVIALAPANALVEKLLSNLQEVRARRGRLYVLADHGVNLPESTDVIRVPAHPGLLSPFVYTPPLQMLAYHTALLRGNDVDKPRNLAKSVTVE